MLRGAMQGEAALSPRMAGRVLKEFRRIGTRLTASDTVGDDDLMDLTKRELEILTIAARGASDKDIADDLYISVHTVKSHMRNILSKLHVNTRREAAKVARNKGLL